MPFDLTIEQQESLREGRAVRLVLPGLGKEVIIFGAETFGADDVESIEDVPQDERERAAFRKFARGQAARVAQENPW